MRTLLKQVLDVGSGSGYLTCVMAAMVREGCGARCAHGTVCVCVHVCVCVCMRACVAVLCMQLAGVGEAVRTPLHTLPAPSRARATGQAGLLS